MMVDGVVVAVLIAVFFCGLTMLVKDWGRAPDQNDDEHGDGWGI